MADRPFAHLHCHSHYSLLDGASRIPELVKTVKERGMNSIALTDHGNLYGAIEFYRECTKEGVNPIIGYEAYVAPGKRSEREAKRKGEAGFHLTLLAKNITGFRNLIKMASIAFLEGYYYVPRIDKDLIEKHSEGVICLSGCAAGEFSDYILKDQMKEAEELAVWFHKVFKDNFYVEIQNNGLAIQEECADGAIAIAEKLGLPLVATCDAHYLSKDDAPAHDVLLCINTRKSRSETNRLKLGNDQFYVKSPEEMYEHFPGQEEAVKRSQEIADGCSIEIDFKARHFPVFTPPDQKTAEEYLRELCEQGLQERYKGKPSQQAIDRLKHELDIINGMGFAGYFLITWDFVRFALERGIPNSARGSACGALVSYVLKLSHVDPLEYDLLFERFLDPNRQEPPDIDIDFCQDRREEVIQYVRDKYGEESVAQIGTFGTMAARAAIKDVGRVLEVPIDRVNKLTAMIPKTLGITLEESLKQSPDFRQEYESDSLIREVIDIARNLEGTNRNAGTHAAGVVIANGPIINYVPVHRITSRGSENGNKGEAVTTTQWVMGDLEKVGMLKMDFLGLRTLTLLDNAIKLIKQTRGLEIDLHQLPLDDEKTYELLQRGDAKGVFQLESEGIRELLKRMKPDNIRDIIAIMALYRPGPLGGGMVDAYVNRKHGREQPEYLNDVMKEILEETHGVMVYQEQIMRILNRLGGIELSSAYACIKAISKKKHDIINQRREEFLKGAVERGVDEKTATEIFGHIMQFGSYGFNKSHTAAYAHVGYQTAYLKAHYTPEFMAALLTSEIEDNNKRDIMREHIEDAKRLGCPVLPPDVNTCFPDFTVQDNKILFGLVAIKGLGRSAAQEIVRCRQEKGPFRDLFDFCERIDHNLVTKAALEKLIKAGGLDSLGGNRNQLMQAMPRAMDAASSLQEDRRHGQMNLFDAFSDEPNVPEEPPVSEGLPNVEEWPTKDKLKFEKEVLDLYLSSHPLAEHEEMLRRFSQTTVKELGNVNPGSEVILGGMLTDIRYLNTKKARNGNSRYIRCKLEDFTGSVDCLMWPDDFDRYKDLVQEDQVLFVNGTLERNRDEPSLVLFRILEQEQVEKERTTGLVISLDLQKHTQEHIDGIARTLQRTNGHVPVFLSINDGHGRRSMLKASNQFKVNPKTFPKAELEVILGPGRVVFSRQRNGR